MLWAALAFAVGIATGVHAAVTTLVGGGLDRLYIVGHVLARAAG